jgi:hypothetical protein
MFLASTLLTLYLNLTTTVENDFRFIFLVLTSSFLVSLYLSEKDYIEEGFTLGMIAVASYAMFSLTLINLNFLLGSYVEIIAVFLSSFLGFLTKRLFLEKIKTRWR